MQADDLYRPMQSVHQLLAALATPADWETSSELVVQMSIQFGGAFAALLISPHNSERLELIYSRNFSNATLSPNRSQIDAPFSVLLDESALIDCLAESGLISGINVRVFLWTDLCAALVLQMPEESSIETSVKSLDDLTSTCRLLLSGSTDRPVILPNPVLLGAMAEFAAGAGHEINNPLGSIIGQTQLMLKLSQSVEHRQACETIGAQAWRIRDMIGNSMLFARPPAIQKTRFDLVELLQQTLQPLTQTAATNDIVIKLASTSDEIMIDADRTQFGSLVGHLVRNSIEAMRSSDTNGVISVTLRDDIAGCVELSVGDNGPGIQSADAKRNLFNPFYSGRAAGRGLGFGLCLAWQIVRLHDGLLIYNPRSESETVFHMAFRTIN